MTPRDVVVSGFNYHTWTEKKWVHIPSERWEELTYQQYLNSLDQELGLEVEMRRLADSQFLRMQAWDYSDRRFLEVRYEDMSGKELEMLPKIFAHYSWPEELVDEAVELADRFSFHNVAARDGEVGETTSHLRSGQPAQWRKGLLAATRRSGSHPSDGCPNCHRT